METRRSLLKKFLAGFAGLAIPSIAFAKRPEDYFFKQIDFSQPSQLLYYGMIAKREGEVKYCIDSDSWETKRIGRLVPGKFIGWMPKSDGSQSIIPIFVHPKFNEDIPAETMFLVKNVGVFWDGKNEPIPDYFIKQTAIRLKGKGPNLLYYGMIRDDRINIGLDSCVTIESEPWQLNRYGFLPGRFIKYLPKRNGQPSNIPLFLHPNANIDKACLTEILKTTSWTEWVVDIPLGSLSE